jgi:tRNA(adenine34) deaminase
MSLSDQAFHVQFMRAALTQAELSLAEGNLPIGAIITHDGKVVATGRNSVDTGNNDTGHAELAAIQSIAPFLFARKRECTIYTTLEPCMMCLGAIVNAGISTVAIGAIDSYVGATGLLAHSAYYRSKQLKVMSGILQLECQALLDEYVRTTGLRQHLSTNPGQ